jgi:pantoate--beta-alanine ligase
MKVIRSVSEMISAAHSLRSEAVKIGFVPTMGYLHEGHLSLIQLSHEHASHTVVSLFVNPTQFGPNEDYSRYPRDEEKDLALCRATGVQLVFAPAVDDLYAQDSSISIVENDLSNVMCGKSRPGHFAGVCTVVAKLFQIVQPDVAVFGQKDAQQVAVIRRMVRDLFFPVEILVGSIIREEDGLARSSRNVYLHADERSQALGLYSALCCVQEAFRKGETDADVLLHVGLACLAREYPAVRLEYLVLCDANTLKPCTRAQAGNLLAIAAHVGPTRLIDNFIL